MDAAVCSFVKLQVSNKLRGKTPANSLKQQTSSAPVGIYSDLEHTLLSLIKLMTFVLLFLFLTCFINQALRKNMNNENKETDEK